MARHFGSAAGSPGNEGGFSITIDVFSPEEQALLEAWFRSAPIDERLGRLLDQTSFDHDCEPYTRLDAWVGTLAVAEIQGRLPVLPS